MADSSVLEPPPKADLIFVLAGRRNRKLYGLELFSRQWAPVILFSVARFEIRAFSTLPLPVRLDLLELAADVPAPLRHFFVWLDSGAVHIEYVRPGRFGTLTEVEALGDWLRKRSAVRSVLIISDRAHLPRIRACCTVVLRREFRVTFHAAPEASSETGKYRRSVQLLIEVGKYVTYQAVLFYKRVRPREIES